jgi:predicted dehydrogenase
VALAHQLVREGRIGQIRHVRASYLQDWAMDENIPLAWRFDARQAGSGSHGDLNAHIIDMARFVTGEEVREICGGIVETFIKQRNLMSGMVSGGLSLGLKASTKKGKVTVDDAVVFLARFSGGAVASFEATRMATGNQNRNGFEINGSKGALRFNFERMNELEFYDATDERKVQGWRTIIVTHGGDHPYASAWWPDAHVIGYEHGFTNMAYDIVLAMAGKKPTVPLPDFNDAFVTQRILQAMMTCAKEKRWVKVSEVK